MHKKKLRVGLLLNAMVVPAWQYRMIEIIQMSEYAEVALVVQKLSAPGIPSRGNNPRRSRNGKSEFRHLLHGVLKRIEYRLVARPGVLPSADELKDCSKLIGASAYVMSVSVDASNVSSEMTKDDLLKIKMQNVDLFIALGGGMPSKDIPDMARYGLWSYHHGQETDGRHVPGYWEVMRSIPVTKSTLCLTSSQFDTQQTLYSSCNSTDVLSLTDNANRIHWKALFFVPRMLRELFYEGNERFFANLANKNSAPSFNDGPGPVSTSEFDFFALLLRKFAQKLRRKIWNAFFFNQWLILFDFRRGLSSNLCRFKVMLPPKDRKWADPFAVHRHGKYYIFIEEFLRANEKGHISVIEMDGDGSWAAPKLVLDESFHLSYPFIFEFEGSTYMIPESVADRSVRLYKCVEFPDRWAFQKKLIDNRRVIDSTLVEWEGVWWLFANQVDADGVSPWDELHLYFSDSPTSDNWTPHPKNPIVSDVTSARPAGKFFIRNGRLYRPSQNSSGHYGYGFNVAEVQKLSKTEYHEVIVSRVEPGWNRNIVSTHTLNHEGELTVIDGQFRRSRFW